MIRLADCDDTRSRVDQQAIAITWSGHTTPDLTPVTSSTNGAYDCSGISSFARRCTYDDATVLVAFYC